MPNITGHFAIRGTSGTGLLLADASVDGAIRNNIEPTTNKVNSAGGWSSYGSYYSFDASKSNAIYGNSTTVQQNAIKLLPVLRY